MIVDHTRREHEEDFLKNGEIIIHSTSERCLLVYNSNVVIIRGVDVIHGKLKYAFLSNFQWIIDKVTDTNVWIDIIGAKGSAERLSKT